MKKLLAFASVLMLFLCCFSIAAVADSRRDAPVSVSLDFPAEQIIVHDPEESLGYDAADEYCLAHSSEVTIRFSPPPRTPHAVLFKSPTTFMNHIISPTCRPKTAAMFSQAA